MHNRESKERIKRELIRLLCPPVSSRNLRILSICKDRITTGIKYTLVLISTSLLHRKKKKIKKVKVTRSRAIYLEPTMISYRGSKRKDARVKTCKRDVSHLACDYWICANTNRIPDNSIYIFNPLDLSSNSTYLKIIKFYSLR